MPLGKHVTYLSEKIMQEQREVDALFWDSTGTQEEFVLACRRETALQYLEDLLEQGEEYYVDF